MPAVFVDTLQGFSGDRRLPPLKSRDAQAIRDRLNQERINHFYHFTSIENLSFCARKGAICSKHILETDEDWPVPQPGGNDDSHQRDRRLGNWDKVSLLFSAHTPMAYRTKSEKHLCFFEISSEVAEFEGVVFTNANAASELSRSGVGVAALNDVRFDLVRSSPQPANPDWRHMSQAEVLIPERVPFQYVQRVCFISEASRDEARRLWGSAQSPNFVVDPEPFESEPGFVGFAFVSKVILTGDEANVHRTRFSKASTSNITAIVNIESLCVFRSSYSNFLNSSNGFSP
jgi:hypothetical protein